MGKPCRSDEDSIRFGVPDPQGIVEPYHMNYVPTSCGPASPMCALAMDGVAMAAARCSKWAGLHCWCYSSATHGPTWGKY